jgi:hypothetical protein
MNGKAILISLCLLMFTQTSSYGNTYVFVENHYKLPAEILVFRPVEAITGGFYHPLTSKTPSVCNPSRSQGQSQPGCWAKLKTGVLYSVEVRNGMNQTINKCRLVLSNLNVRIQLTVNLKNCSLKNFIG